MEIFHQAIETCIGDIGAIEEGDKIQEGDTRE